MTQSYFDTLRIVDLLCNHSNILRGDIITGDETAEAYGRIDDKQ